MATENISSSSISRIGPMKREIGIFSSRDRETVLASEPFERGLLRFADDGKSVIDTITGKGYSRLSDAVNLVSSRRMESVDLLTGNVYDDSRYGVLSDLVQNLNDYIKLDTTVANAHRDANEIFRHPVVRGGNLELVRVNYSGLKPDDIKLLGNLHNRLFGKGTAMGAEHYTGQLKDGKILPPGILSTNERSATLLMFRTKVGDSYQYLTGLETQDLLSATGSGVLGQDDLLKALAKGSGQNLEYEISKALGKVPKRSRSHTSPRNFVMRQDEVSTMLKSLGRGMDKTFKGQAPKTLEEAILQTDSSLIKTLRALGPDLEDRYHNFTLDAAEKDGGITARKQVLRQRTGERLVMETQGQDAAKSFFRTALDMQGLDAPGEETAFFDFMIKNIKETMDIAKSEGRKDITFKEVMKHVEKSAGIETSRHFKYLNILNEMDKIEDGSGFMTDFAFMEKAKMLKGEIKTLDKQILNPATGETERVIAQKRKSNLINRLSLFVEDVDSKEIVIKPLRHQTGRMLFGERGQGKGVFDIISDRVKDGLRKIGYIGAGSTELFKKEVTFGAATAPGSEMLGAFRANQITLDLIDDRHGFEGIYTEPQAMIYHRQLYGPEFTKEVRRIDARLGEGIAEIQSGFVSENLRASIYQDANINLSLMDEEDIIRRFGSRSKASAFVLNARRLQEQLSRPGVKVNEIPDLANSLIDHISRNAFRVKRPKGGSKTARGTVEWLLPYAQRNAIDTESAVSKRFSPYVIGGPGVAETTKIPLNNTDSLELFKYRFMGHKMIVSDTAATRLGLYEAAGGFDLDDKFINNLRTITDARGEKRLVSFVWRQPTGPQEFALLSPHLDDATMTRMLGSNTDFGSRFRGMSKALSDMMNFDSGFDPTFTETGLGNVDHLSREEKIFKLLNSLAHNNQKVASAYRGNIESGAGGSISQMELESAIIRIGEIGKSDTFELGGKTINTRNFAKSWLFPRRKLLGKNSLEIDGMLDNRYMDIAEIHQDIVKKYFANAPGGTPMKLGPEEISKLGLLESSQYRDSTMNKMVGGNTVLAEDKAFMSTIRDIWGKKVTGQSFAEYEAELRNSGEYMSNMALHFNAGSELLSRDIEGVRSPVVQAFNILSDKMGLSSFGVQSDLAPYINQLAWAGSLDEQLSAVQKAAAAAAGDGGSALLKRVKNMSLFIYDPETTIDPAKSAGGGQYGMKMTAEDITKIYTDSMNNRNIFINAEEARNSVTATLYGFTKDREKELELLKVELGFSGRTKDFFDRAIHGELGPETQGRVRRLIDASAKSVGRSAIETRGTMLGSSRAAQLLYPDIFPEEIFGKIGIDALAAKGKLSVIFTGSDESDIEATVRTMSAAMQKAVSDGSSNVSTEGLAQLKTEIEDLTVMSGKVGGPGDKTSKQVGTLHDEYVEMYKYTGVAETRYGINNPQDIGDARLKSTKLEKTRNRKNQKYRGLGDTRAGKTTESNNLYRNFEDDLNKRGLARESLDFKQRTARLSTESEFLRSLDDMTQYDLREVFRDLNKKEMLDRFHKEGAIENDLFELMKKMADDDKMESYADNSMVDSFSGGVKTHIELHRSEFMEDTEAALKKSIEGSETFDITPIEATKRFLYQAQDLKEVKGQLEFGELLEKTVQEGPFNVLVNEQSYPMSHLATLSEAGIHRSVGKGMHIGLSNQILEGEIGPENVINESTERGLDAVLKRLGGDPTQDLHTRESLGKLLPTTRDLSIEDSGLKSFPRLSNIEEIDALLDGMGAEVERSNQFVFRRVCSVVTK